MIKPPPIQEPWQTDKLGRLVNPAWLLWFQDLVNSSAVDEIFGNTLTLQSTTEATSSSTVSAASDESTISIWMNF